MVVREVDMPRKVGMLSDRSDSPAAYCAAATIIANQIRRGRTAFRTSVRKYKKKERQTLFDEEASVFHFL